MAPSIFRKVNRFRFLTLPKILMLYLASEEGREGGKLAAHGGS